MFKCKNKICPQAVENLFTLKPKNKYQLKRSCIHHEPLYKSKFTQLCMNYRGAYLRNKIVLSQNTDLEQFTTLKHFKEKLKGTLMQIWKSEGILASHKKICRRFRIITAFTFWVMSYEFCAPEIYGMFVYKHTETIEFVKEHPTF